MYGAFSVYLMLKKTRLYSFLAQDSCNFCKFLYLPVFFSEHILVVFGFVSLIVCNTVDVKRFISLNSNMSNSFVLQDPSDAKGTYMPTIIKTCAL